jgi:hypothetical protein
MGESLLSERQMLFNVSFFYYKKNFVSRKGIWLIFQNDVLFKAGDCAATQRDYNTVEWELKRVLFSF